MRSAMAPLTHRAEVPSQEDHSTNPLGAHSLSKRPIPGRLPQRHGTGYCAGRKQALEKQIIQLSLKGLPQFEAENEEPLLRVLSKNSGDLSEEHLREG